MRSRDDVDAALIKALHEEQWVEVLEDLRAADEITGDARDRVDEVVEATRILFSQVDGERAAVIAGLTEAGISAEPGDPIGPDGAGTVAIDPSQLHAVVQHLTSRGFMPSRNLSAGAFEALGRFYNSAAMVAPAGALTRVRLTWDRTTNRSGLRRLVWPSMADLTAVRLPRYLWPAYWFVRPVRRIVELVFRNSRVSAPLLFTPESLILELLTLVDPTPGELLVDLGCGDARVLIGAARQFGCRGLGIESDERLVEVARTAVRRTGLSDRIHVQVGDFANANLGEANIVFAFLPVGIVNENLPTILDSMGPGARLITHEQAAVDWRIEPTHRCLLIDPGGITVGYVWESVA